MNPTIFILDDDPDQVALVTAQLERSRRFVTKGFTRPSELLEELRSDPPDLVVCDLVMPGMSGREVAEALRAARPEIKVLYMSGHSGDVLTHDAAPGDQTPMIEKPFDRRGLLRSVRSALA